MQEVLRNVSLSSINQMFDLAAVQADEGNIAGARMLERQAQLLGRTGSVSGFLTMDLESMKAAGRTRNSFTNSSLVSGLSVGSKTSGFGSATSSFGGRSLTRSSKRRRSGRNRNPRGRNDKASVRIEKAWKRWKSSIDKEFGFDTVKFAGTERFGRPTRFHPMFGNNSNLSKNQMMNAVMKEQLHDPLAKRDAETRRRIGNFKSTMAGTRSMEEALMFLDLGFGRDQRATFDPSESFVNEVQDTIQARNFFRGRNVKFDGMDTGGLAGLLNIREFGYREMNEQLAFQGQEQYQTVGT